MKTVVRVVAASQGELVTRDYLDLKLASVFADLLVVKWMMGAAIGLAIANFAKQFF